MLENKKERGGGVLLTHAILLLSISPGERAGAESLRKTLRRRDGKAGKWTTSGKKPRSAHAAENRPSPSQMRTIRQKKDWAEDKTVTLSRTRRRHPPVTARRSRQSGTLESKNTSACSHRRKGIGGVQWGGGFTE